MEFAPTLARTEMPLHGVGAKLCSPPPRVPGRSFFGPEVPLRFFFGLTWTARGCVRATWAASGVLGSIGLAWVHETCAAKGASLRIYTPLGTTPPCSTKPNNWRTVTSTAFAWARGRHCTIAGLQIVWGRCCWKFAPDPRINGHFRVAPFQSCARGGEPPFLRHQIYRVIEPPQSPRICQAGKGPQSQISQHGGFSWGGLHERGGLHVSFL
jgi:hypothetical protein